MEMKALFYRNFKWSFVSLLYEDSSYGENGALAVEMEGSADGICFGLKAKISANDDDERLKNVVNELLQQNNTNGKRYQLP